MKFPLLFIVFLSIHCSMIAGSGWNIMTYNLRYNNPGDGENQWTKRIQKVDALLQKYQPDLLGIQEGLADMILDLKKMRSLKGFEIVGVGREDGKEKGEYSAICFSGTKFKQLSSGTFWLSPTPDSVGSIGWDAALTRICTWIKLEERKGGKQFFVFNTHFDHIGEKAREESAKLIVQKISELAGSLPVVLMGDFNSEPSQKGYQSIVMNSIHPLHDTHDVAAERRESDDCTFKGFQVKSSICKRIDFIFTDDHFKIEQYTIIDDNDGINYPSDHKPILSKLVFY